MNNRYVVVDDTSSTISYIGDSWFADVGSQDATDNGPPYLSTLHGTNNSASLAFNFIGSAVVVMGTNRIRNNSGVINPQWSCYVDGVGIYSGSPFPYPENNWAFCSSYSLDDGPHTITVNITVTTGQTFWFDRIDYLPSTSVSLANKTIMLTSVDPAIQYGAGWHAYEEIGNWTQTQGAFLALDFYGTSLSWYGDIPGELNGNSTTATWVIDDNPAQTFVLEGHGANSTTAYNQKFFETPVYPFASHKLIVTYNGDSSKTPLVVGNIYLQNDTAVPSSTSMDRTSSHTPIIVGGVIGGVACLLIVFLLVLFVVCRRRQKLETDTRITVYTPANSRPASQVFPYNAPSRLPAKAITEYSPGSNFLPFHCRTESGPSGVETAAHLRSLTTNDGRLPPTPIDNPPAYAD